MRDDRLVRAFIEGAQWWEYHQTETTMGQADQKLALEEAEKREAKGTLGLSWEELAELFRGLKGK